MSSPSLPHLPQPSLESGTHYHHRIDCRKFAVIHGYRTGTPLKSYTSARTLGYPLPLTHKHANTCTCTHTHTGHKAQWDSHPQYYTSTQTKIGLRRVEATNISASCTITPVALFASRWSHTRRWWRTSVHSRSLPDTKFKSFLALLDDRHQIVLPDEDDGSQESEIVSLLYDLRFDNKKFHTSSFSAETDSHIVVDCSYHKNTR